MPMYAGFSPKDARLDPLSAANRIDFRIDNADVGRLFEIAPQFLADKTNRLLDFGWCLLRMNTRQ